MYAELDKFDESRSMRSYGSEISDHFALRNNMADEFDAQQDPKMA